MCTSALLTLTLQASLGIDPHLDLDDNFGGDLKGRVHVHASATMAPAAEEEVEVKKGEQLPPQSPQRLVARLAATEATKATEARVAAKMEAKKAAKMEARVAVEARARVAAETEARVAAEAKDAAVTTIEVKPAPALAPAPLPTPVLALNPLLILPKIT